MRTLTSCIHTQHNLKACDRWNIKTLFLSGSKLMLDLTERDTYVVVVWPIYLRNNGVNWHFICPNFRFVRGDTALHKAASQQHHEVCRRLLEAGASLSKTNFLVRISLGFLFVSARNSCSTIVKPLYAIDLLGKNSQGLCPGCRELRVGFPHGEPAGGWARGTRGSGDGCMNGLTRLVLGRFLPTESGCQHSSARLLTLERAWEGKEEERGVTRTPRAEKVLSEQENV